MYLDPKARASCWSVTAFYDTEHTPSKQTREYQIEDARRHGWVVEGQSERCPTTGHLHFQLIVKTPQVRARAVMNAFPSAEIQIARNEHALEAYVHKEETRDGVLKSVKVAISWTNVCDKFFEWVECMGYDTETNFERRLELWDEFINDSIAQGVRCELIGVNPQYRSCIGKYWSGMFRSYGSKQKDTTSVDRQTDRQTEEVSVPIYTTNADESSCVEEKVERKEDGKKACRKVRAKVER